VDGWFILTPNCGIHLNFVRDLRFIDWYERWLDHALEGPAEEWFGFDNLNYLG
jgi:hypothetical protein